MISRRPTFGPATWAFSTSRRFCPGHWVDLQARINRRSCAYSGKWSTSTARTPPLFSLFVLLCTPRSVLFDDTFILQRVWTIVTHHLPFYLFRLLLFITLVHMGKISDQSALPKTRSLITITGVSLWFAVIVRCTAFPTGRYASLIHEGVMELGINTAILFPLYSHQAGRRFNLHVILEYNGWFVIV